MAHTPVTQPAQLTPAVFEAFRVFINQRPGLDPNNYYNPADLAGGRRATYLDGVRSYQAEARSIQKDGTRARKALAHAREFPFDPAAMLDAFRAFSGRLTPVTRRMDYALTPDDAKRIQCTHPECEAMASTGQSEGAPPFWYHCDAHAAEWRADRRPPAVALDYTTGQYFPTEYRKAAATVLEAYCEAVRPKFTPTPAQAFRTVADMEAANHAAGGHWFSRENKRFFRSRILPGLYHGRPAQHPHGPAQLIYFVSSEKSGFEDSSPRNFHVRIFDTATASVNTPPDSEWDTAIEARRVAARLAQMDRRGEHVRHTGQGEACPFCGHYGEGCSGSVVHARVSGGALCDPALPMGAASANPPEVTCPACRAALTSQPSTPTAQEVTRA